MSEKRILFAGISTMRDHAGQHKLYFIADAFSRSGIPVSVLVPDFPENREFLRARPRIEPHYYPPGTVLSDFRHRTRIVRQGNWSAVWVVGVGLRSGFARDRRAGAPALIKDFDEFPSMIESFGPMRRAYLRWIEGRMIAQADGFTCASAFLEQAVRRRRPGLGGRVLRLPVAISEHEHRVIPSLFEHLCSTDRQRPVLLYIGSLNRFYEDQLDEIIALAQVLARRESPAVVRVLGGGPDADYFKARARAANLGGALQFAGHVNRHELASHMAAARVLLFPFPATPFNLSRCPTKAYHYAAANRPVVTNRTGEVEALFGDAALYYPERNVAALADACEKALEVDRGFNHSIPFASLTWEARARQFARWLEEQNETPPPRAPRPGGHGDKNEKIVRGYLWALVPAACGIAVSLLFFTLSRDHATWLTWTKWVPFGLWPVFNDLTLTLQHLREAEHGLDVLRDLTSQFAYPRAVLALRHLGLHHLPSEWLGLAQGMLFTLATVLVLQPFTFRRAAGTAALLLTPAMLLGFERGNIDFALFPLCAGAAWLWSRCEPSRKPKLAVLALASAAVLKLYPVFGLMAAAIAEKSRRRLYWIVGAGAILVYFYAIRADLALVREKVPVIATSSWGSLVTFARIEDHLEKQPGAPWLATIDWSLVALLTYGAVFACALRIGKRLAPRFAALQWRTDEWCYYWVGAGICCGCFAAANFVYRWAFALLAIPLLLRAAHSSDRLLARWACIAICAMAIGFVAKFSLPVLPFALVQLANWLFIFMLIVGASGLHFSAAHRQQAAAGGDEEPAGGDTPTMPAAAAQTWQDRL